MNTFVIDLHGENPAFYEGFYHSVVYMSLKT